MDSVKLLMEGYNMSKPLGYILYEGSSILDDKPIVVVLTGVSRLSKNVKTGAMAQVYIIRSDVSPIFAVESGEDFSICGDCIHRGDDKRKRSCYVRYDQGATNVFKAYRRGRYAVVSPSMGELAEYSDKIGLRVGSYGDPSAVPYGIWSRLLSHGWQGVTSYTHQWRRYHELASFCMASVDSTQEQAQASFLGFRTFRVRPSGDDTRLQREVVCPASREAGFKTVCAACKACGGNAAKAKAHVVITSHGMRATNFKGE